MEKTLNILLKKTASASYPCRERSPGIAEDLLPPFSTLSSDEEREQKANLTQPGTYHVIVNQRSFSNLPEYATEASVADIPDSPKTDAENDDPNVIVLRKFETFEEPIAKLTTQTLRTTINSPATLTTIKLSGASTPQDYSTNSFSDLSQLSLLEQAQNGGTDSHLLQHYRSTISHHVVQIGRTDSMCISRVLLHLLISRTW